MPHRHAKGQHIIVTDGVGVVADEEHVHVVRPGDVISSPPGGWHWHGATPTTAMSHVTIEDPGLDLDVDAAIGMKLYARPRTLMAATAQTLQLYRLVSLTGP